MRMLPFPAIERSPVALPHADQDLLKRLVIGKDTPQRGMYSRRFKAHLIANGSPMSWSVPPRDVHHHTSTSSSFSSTSSSISTSVETPASRA